MTNQEKLFFATVLGIEYTKGEFELVQGHKAGDRTGYVGEGCYINFRGYGWAERRKPSKLVAKVEVNGETFDIWIDRDFKKDQWAKLTDERIGAIRATMPQMIVVREEIRKDGSPYYVLQEDASTRWRDYAQKYANESICQKEIDQWKMMYVEMLNKRLGDEAKGMGDKK